MMLQCRIALGILLTFAGRAAADPIAATLPTTQETNAERHRHQAFLKDPILFESFSFSGDKFPKADFKDPDLVQDLIGKYTLSTTFYNSKFELVTIPEQPGRYGAVIQVKTAAGQVDQRYLTLFREANPVNWEKVRSVVSTTLPVETGIDPAIANRPNAPMNDFARWRFTDGLRHDADGARLLCWMYEAKPADAAKASWNRPYYADMKWWAQLKQKMNLPVYQYMTYEPASYDQDPSKKWPMILFLHGSGERGDQLTDINNTGLTKWLLKQKEFPFVVISPQCPWQEYWNPWELNEMLDQVTRKYHVDEKRIYVTGLSMGGAGAWDLAAEFPRRFAAIAPISGEADPADIIGLKDLPIWVFHGGKDDLIDNANECVAALRAAGSKVKYTLYPDGRHDVWSRTYADPALYDWLLQQHLAANR